MANMYMDMCCAWCPQRFGEGIGSFRTKVMDGYVPLYGCWEPDPSPL